MPETLKVKYANGMATDAAAAALAAAPATVNRAALEAAQEMWAASPNGEYWEQLAQRLPEERLAGSRPEPSAAAIREN